MAVKGMSVFRQGSEDFTINDPNIAEEFSASKNYAAGDGCYYQGNLHRFKAAHAAGAWTGSDAEIVKLTDTIDIRGQRASVEIEETISNITTTNYDYLFDRRIKPGQKLHLIVDVGQGAQVIIYKILKKNDTSVREVVLAYMHNADIDILSTEDKPVWGIRLYIYSVQSATESMYVNMRALSPDQSIDDFDDTKLTLYRDINEKHEHTITNVDNYTWLFPYRIFPNQKLHYKASITGGNFYLYKVNDRNDTTKRTLIPSAVSVNSTEGVIEGSPDETFVGFYVWISNVVENSKLSIEFYAEGFRNENIIIPRAEIEPVLANLNWNKTGSNVERTYAPLVMLHFSDVHGDIRATRRILNFFKKYKKYLADVIHTGDAMLDCYENGYNDIWNESKFLQVIGNHDAWTNGTSGCKAWTTGYSAKQCYNRYIAPIASVISSVENKCYWSKTYLSQKIMLITIDNYHWKETIYDTNNDPLNAYPDGEGLDNGEQLTWFVSKLQDAKTAGYGVIVASHMPAVTDAKQCSFSTLLSESTGGIPQEAITAVQDFIDGGGEFITWLCGHTHYDMIGELENNADQSIIVIDTARAEDRPGGNNWEENARVIGTRSENLFNVFSVDRNKKYIILHRIGMEYDKFGRHVGSLVYDYENKEIVWNS